MLPHIENAYIPKEKITGYLLSNTHRDGKTKAILFNRFGFSLNNWQELANALLKHAQENQIIKTEISKFGTKYLIDGSLSTPQKKLLMIRSIWFIEAGKNTPVFVTAYPLKRRK
jgi:hypothetical protein